ncbi:NUDIX family hydrolase [Viridothelium virens]|uniref:NUDIX family hydrolase n=1 Tax=Viridothelium virens TaxID=1048519 RepID=A0A6A6HL75_VIRVR|nr:NUDIX family hydrolase [Viridothelium virens]
MNGISPEIGAKLPEFELDVFAYPVKVQLTPDVTKDELCKFPPFELWINTLKKSFDHQASRPRHPFHDKPYRLCGIRILSVSRFGARLGFVHLHADIRNEENKELPGAVFLRGGTVAVLPILRPRDSVDERWVVMTLQARVPAGSLSFMEIPAGMTDDDKDMGKSGIKAAQEMKEETGLEIRRDELIDLTGLALQDALAPESKHLERAMYPSPGGCDEFMRLYLWEKEMDRQEIEDLKGRLTGLRTQKEMIEIRLCRYEELWREGTRDAKTLAAWALYEGLKRAGKL